MRFLLKLTAAAVLTAALSLVQRRSGPVGPDQSDREVADIGVSNVHLHPQLVLRM